MASPKGEVVAGASKAAEEEEEDGVDSATGEDAEECPPLMEGEA